MKKNNKLLIHALSLFLVVSVNQMVFAETVAQDPTIIPYYDSSVVDSVYFDGSSTSGGTFSSTNYGGGLYNIQSAAASTYGVKGTLYISTGGNSVISNVTAVYIATVDQTDYELGRKGGVIYNAGDLYIGCTGSGAGSLTATGYSTTFSNNSAGEGGAIYNNVGNVFIYNTTFLGNTAYKNDSYSGGATLPEVVVDAATSGRGGAICNYSGDMYVYDSSFDNNTAVYGGAVYNGVSGQVHFYNTNFSGNTATNDGGAIYNNASGLSLSGSSIIYIDAGTYDSNTSVYNGGAIYSATSNAGTSVEVNISNATFSNNQAGPTSSSGAGGAIYVSSNNVDAESKLTVSNSTFENNGYTNGASYATSQGGAIYNYSADVTISDSSFTGNVANTYGGAIYSTGSDSNAATVVIDKTSFSDNGYIYITNSQAASAADVTTTYGGAVYNNSYSTLSVTNSEFDGNYASYNGGAVYNAANGTVDISDTSFTNNGYYTYAGSSTSSASNGGAVYNAGDMTITDSSFSGNIASRGGAIYAASGSTTTVLAENKDVVFTSSSSDRSVDSIYVAGADSSTANMNFNANTGRTVNVNGSVTGVSNDYSLVNVNYDSSGSTAYTGNGNVNFNGGVDTVHLTVYNGTATANDTVSNSKVETSGGTMKFANDSYLGTYDSTLGAYTNQTNDLILSGGTLDIQNGVVSNIALNSLTLNSTTNLKVDVDVVNQTMDNILSTNITNYSGQISSADQNVNISSMALVSESSVDSATIFFTDAIAYDNVTTDVSTIEGKIYKYAVNKVSGASVQGSVSDDSTYFTFNNTYNPSDNVIAGPVAQIGAFLMMDNLYRQSFANMDMLSILTRDERETLKNYNRYSNMFEDEVNTFYQDKRQEDYASAFVRPFTNFEHVPLKHGPRVSNVFYGSLIGHESGLYELGRGWDANYAVFGAYSGAHQTANGIGIWQNGGAVGGVFTAYKGDFWAGLTANAGGWAVEANNDYGHEHFPMLGTGVAGKMGYNWRLFDNKFIIQPSYMMSYTFIYAYSHDTAAGVNIKQDPLHAIEIIPGIKLIANNFRGGWQPYLGVNMTWVIMEGARFWANDVIFDRLSIKPFVEYGIGIQKHHGERATGYLQAMVRNGGRNGVALTGGFRWAIGDDIID